MWDLRITTTAVIYHWENWSSLTSHGALAIGLAPTYLPPFSPSFTGYEDPLFIKTNLSTHVIYSFFFPLGPCFIFFFHSLLFHWFHHPCFEIVSNLFHYRWNRISLVATTLPLSFITKILKRKCMLHLLIFHLFFLKIHFNVSSMSTALLKLFLLSLTIWLKSEGHFYSPLMCGM